MTRSHAFCLVVLPIFIAACHSDPFVRGYEGSTGPLTSGADGERLTYAGPNEDGVPFQALRPIWAEGGRGIVFSFSPRPYPPGEKKLARSCVLNIPCHPIALDVGDTCLAMVPPTGGSAYWNLCESRSGHSGTNDRIAGNVNEAGQLLYTELTDTAGELPFPFFPPPPPPPFPASHDLWLATPAAPLSRRRVPGGANLVDIEWSSGHTFTAISGAGLVEGTILADTSTIRGVGALANVVRYALVENNRAAIFVSGDRLVHHVTIADGTTTTIATLPLGAGGQALDVGCHPDVCIVLASGGGTPGSWNLWKVDIATGVSVIVRTFTHPVTAARLSPVTGDVVALEGANLYLLPRVVP